MRAQLNGTNDRCARVRTMTIIEPITMEQVYDNAIDKSQSQHNSQQQQHHHQQHNVNDNAAVSANGNFFTCVLAVFYFFGARTAQTATQRQTSEKRLNFSRMILELYLNVLIIREMNNGLKIHVRDSYFWFIHGNFEKIQQQVYVLRLYFNIFHKHFIGLFYAKATNFLHNSDFFDFN